MHMLQMLVFFPQMSARKGVCMVTDQIICLYIMLFAIFHPVNDYNDALTTCSMWSRERGQDSSSIKILWSSEVSGQALVVSCFQGLLQSSELFYKSICNPTPFFHNYNKKLFIWCSAGITFDTLYKNSACYYNCLQCTPVVFIILTNARCSGYQTVHELTLKDFKRW